jgi:hypothetical protein
MSVEDAPSYSESFEGISPDVSDVANVMPGDFPFSEEPQRGSFANLEDDKKLDAAYALLDSFEDKGSAEEKITEPAPASAPSTVPISNSKSSPEKFTPKSSASPVKKGNTQTNAKASPPLMSHSHVSQSTSFLPRTFNAIGDRVQRNSLEFALTQKPFFDVGLRYAVENVDRITGSMSIVDAATAGSNTDALLNDNDGSVLNVVGGSSGYIRKENSRVRASLSLSIDPTTSNANEYQLASSPVNINISAANVDDVDDADDIEIAEFPNQHEYLYQQHTNNNLNLGNGQGNVNNNRDKTFERHLATVGKMKSNKSIAGFVSEPWKTDPTGAQVDTSVLTGTLLNVLNDTETEGVRDNTNTISNTSGRKKVLPKSTHDALDSQTKNRYSTAIQELIPSVGILHKKKALIPLKGDRDDTTRTNTNTNNIRKRTTVSGGGHGNSKRRQSKMEEYVMTECLELAATQAELQATLEKQIKSQLNHARKTVQEKIYLDSEHERKTENRVLEFVEKTYEAKKRIKELQSSKGENIAAKESDKQAFRDAMLQQQTLERIERAEEKKRSAMERKLRISEQFKHKNKEMEETVMAKLAQSKITIEQKAEQQKLAHEKRANEREKRIQEKIVYANEFEFKRTVERAQQLEQKDENYERVKNIREETLEESTMKRKVKDTIASFRAEQRRMMLDIKRKAEMELGRIRQTQEAVLANKRRQTAAQRPIKLHSIYAEQLRKQHEEQVAAGTVDEGLGVTPGPGEYFKNITKKVSPGGGYMASSRPEQRYSEVPGPGHYSNEETKTAGAGCIPFMGRGKTDVDILQLRASKLPGVGQYEVSKEKGKSGRSVKLTGKGTTQLDRIIDKAAKLPGPGDYNLTQDATHKPGSMEAYLLGESDSLY